MNYKKKTKNNNFFFFFFCWKFLMDLNSRSICLECLNKGFDSIIGKSLQQYFETYEITINVINQFFQIPFNVK